MLRAIETVYNGYRFRSRLEARWAIFFDALGIAYQYEPEGFVVGCNRPRRYLPDFLLPELGCWVEVKGTADQLDFQLLADAVDWESGLPGLSGTVGQDRGLLLLGPIPFVHPGNVAVHPFLQHLKGGWLGTAYFVPGGVRCCTSGEAYFDSSWGSQERAEWVELCKGLFSGCLHFGAEPVIATAVGHAYAAARRARFEHGETPRGPGGH